MPRKKKPNPAPPELGGTFDPLVLDKTVIAIPLLDKIRQETMAGAARTIYKVIIDLNLEYPTAAKARGIGLSRTSRRPNRSSSRNTDRHPRRRMSISQRAARRTNICLPHLKVASFRNLFVWMNRRRGGQRKQPIQGRNREAVYGEVHLIERFTESGPISK